MSVTPPGGSKPLRWARDLFSRSIGLERRNKQLHVVLVEKPRLIGGERSDAPLLQLRDELRARFLVHEADTQAITNVYLVYKALDRAGWPGVEALPRLVVDRALAETETMQMEEPSPLLTTLVGRLQAVIAVDDERLLRQKAERPADDDLQIPEVSEVSHEEYAVIERSWVGTIPADLDAQAHSPSP